MESSVASSAMHGTTGNQPSDRGGLPLAPGEPDERREPVLRGTAWATQHLRAAVKQGVVTAPTPIPETSFQPASLDLRLGPVAHRLRCSFLPGPRRVEEALRDYSMGTLDLSNGAVLDRNRPYLIPLIEELRLPRGVSARANPRSSTGRLDIFTRTVTDRSEQFDDIAAGYRGKLYLEVVPRSFTVKVVEGLTLSQLRLFEGSNHNLDDVEVSAVHRETALLFEGAEAVQVEELHLRHGLFLSMDLSGSTTSNPIVGYRAKKNSHLLDLSLIEGYDPREFWEPVWTEAHRIVVLEPEEFYLFYSQERVRVPSHLAADMVAFDASAGELRTHYAGFFDPGFGERAADEQGSHAVLEVRAHDVPFAVAHGQRICKLSFQRLKDVSDTPYGPQIGSRYNSKQLVLLPRQFRRFPDQQPKFL